jgi:AraC-like DNA-binding protein
MRLARRRSTLTFDSSLKVYEKRFRLLYAGVYLSLVLVTAILAQSLNRFSDASLDSWNVLVVCCALGMILSIGAVSYRQIYSLASMRACAPKPPTHPRAKQAALKVKSLLETERVFTNAELSVAGLAQLVGEPKYRVSQGIVSELGFANFNQLINHYRTKLAARKLADPKLATLPILTIAIDCGFTSMGPFNRAFRQEFGKTPSEYRKSSADC